MNKKDLDTYRVKPGQKIDLADWDPDDKRLNVPPLPNGWTVRNTVPLIFDQLYSLGLVQDSQSSFKTGDEFRIVSPYGQSQREFPQDHANAHDMFELFLLNQIVCH